MAYYKDPTDEQIKKHYGLSRQQFGKGQGAESWRNKYKRDPEFKSQRIKEKRAELGIDKASYQARKKSADDQKAREAKTGPAVPPVTDPLVDTIQDTNKALDSTPQMDVPEGKFTSLAGMAGGLSDSFSENEQANLNAMFGDPNSSFVLQQIMGLGTKEEQLGGLRAALGGADPEYLAQQRFKQTQASGGDPFADFLKSQEQAPPTVDVPPPVDPNIKAAQDRFAGVQASGGDAFADFLKQAEQVNQGGTVQPFVPPTPPTPTPPAPTPPAPTPPTATAPTTPPKPTTPPAQPSTPPAGPTAGPTPAGPTPPPPSGPTPPPVTPVPPPAPPATAGGTVATGAPAAPQATGITAAGNQQIQDRFGINQFMSSAQQAEQQRRSQSQELDRRLEDTLNERLANRGQQDAITTSRLADFEASNLKNQAQLEENLQRLGILTTGGDTAEQLSEFAGAAERSRQGIMGEGQARQERAFQDTLGLLQSRRQDLALQQQSEQQDRERALKQVLGLGEMEQRGSQFDRDIALRSELGRGQLGLGRDRFGLEAELGRGQLGLQREEFGEGRRQFERGQGFREEMGRGQLGLQREQFGEDRRQFERGQGFKEEMGRGQLGLQREEFGEGRRQFDAGLAQRGELGREGFATTRRGQDIQKELGVAAEGRLQSQANQQRTSDIFGGIFGGMEALGIDKKDIFGAGKSILGLFNGGGGPASTLGKVAGAGAGIAKAGSGLFSGGITGGGLASATQGMGGFGIQGGLGAGGTGFRVGSGAGQVGSGLGAAGQAAQASRFSGAGAGLGNANMALAFHQGGQLLQDILGSRFRGSEGLGNIGSRAGTGAAIGSVVPGVGTAIGAGVGAAIGGVENLWSGGPVSKNLDEVKAMPRSHQAAIVTEGQRRERAGEPQMNLGPGVHWTDIQALMLG